MQQRMDLCQVLWDAVPCLCLILVSAGRRLSLSANCCLSQVARCSVYSEMQLVYAGSTLAARLLAVNRLAGISDEYADCMQSLKCKEAVKHACLCWL